MIEPVPAIRVRRVNGADFAPGAGYVLYWMIAQRRTRRNFALQHAAWHAQTLGKPLVVLEALRVGYRFASDRLHAFVLDGMADNAARFADSPVRYLPYVEREAGEGRGLLAALAERACVVVTDEYPVFFLPRMVEAAGRQLGVRLEAVDANGILPLRTSEAEFKTAHAFRRFLQREGPAHLGAVPMDDPISQLPSDRRARLARELGQRWPMARAAELAAGERAWVAELPIDHSVPPVAVTGGPTAARAHMQRFISERLDRYADGRNHPDDDASSGLSPWLHFGHLGAHELVVAVLEREGWDPGRLGDVRQTRGSRSGWWGVGEAAEAFLDEAVTWRELGQHFAWHRRDYQDYDSLPSWARETLEDHAGDPRPDLYSFEQLERAETGDDIWNAAQRQLVASGRMHNYLRMLWGKKILEWSAHPRTAIERMIVLNDKYALDGRDPNSYSGIFWICGRFDRPWGPERPIFGKIRYMSSDSTRRKLHLRGYLERWSGTPPRQTSLL